MFPRLLRLIEGLNRPDADTGRNVSRLNVLFISKRVCEGTPVMSSVASRLMSMSPVSVMSPFSMLSSPFSMLPAEKSSSSVVTVSDRSCDVFTPVRVMTGPLCESVPLPLPLTSVTTI